MNTILKGIIGYFVVALPTLFMLVWTIDAALVPGADVFFVALAQAIFLAGLFVYLWRRGGRPQTEAVLEPAWLLPIAHLRKRCEYPRLGLIRVDSISRRRRREHIRGGCDGWGR